MLAVLLAAAIVLITIDFRQPDGGPVDRLQRLAITVFGRPLIRSRPRTSAFTSSSVGAADPMAILIYSAVRSPMAMPYSRRT